MPAKMLLRFLGVAGVALLLSSCFIKKNAETASRPNIIVILADDAGYADFGFMGSKDIQTPNLDGLKNEDEANFFRGRFLDRINVSQAARNAIEQDVSADNFQYYLNEKKIKR